MTPVISLLQKKLGQDKVLLGDDVKERYSHIWKMDQPLQAKAYLLPRTTQDISDILKTCNEHHQKVAVFGGLTNLVGATENTPDEIIISLEKMNNIEEVDEMSRTITIQSGVILENIQNAAKAKNLMFPLNFGAKGSAQAGGFISTNAGGLRVFRYGMTRNLVLGLEAVLADGTVISSMKKIIKDNSAYDIKQLFIGSEGTLGIITKAILKLQEAPKSRNSAFIGINNYNNVITFLKHMDGGLAGTLSGFELIWNNTFQAFTSPENIQPPLPYDYEYYVLIESLGSHQQNDHEAMQLLLESALEKEIIEDAVMGHSESDLEWFWKIREDVKVINALCHYDQHFDISLPIPLIGDLLNEMYEKLLAIPKVEACYNFGHVADGNIHLIVDRTEETPELIHQINEIVYGPLKAIGGSVSAEHGIGLHKKKYLHLCRTEEEIEMMKTLKRNFDPKGILNAGRVLEM